MNRLIKVLLLVVLVISRSLLFAQSQHFNEIQLDVLCNTDPSMNLRLVLSPNTEDGHAAIITKTVSFINHSEGAISDEIPDAVSFWVEQDDYDSIFNLVSNFSVSMVKENLVPDSLLHKYNFTIRVYHFPGEIVSFTMEQPDYESERRNTESFYLVCKQMLSLAKINDERLLPYHSSN